METVLRQHQLHYERLLDRDGSVLTPGIKLTTFHSAKGLEFGEVVLVGLTDGIFPRLLSTRQASEGESSDDEEEALRTARRVLYVAMTRAKHRLYLLCGTPPSRFVAELDATLFRRTAPELETGLPAAVSLP
jgi:superfamily I DNA/RNA helicase